MRIIRVKLDWKDQSLFQSTDSERQLAAVVDRARKWAGERTIKFQKRVSFGGDCSGNCYMLYSSHAVRDLLIESLNANMITITKVE